MGLHNNAAYATSLMKKIERFETSKRFNETLLQKLHCYFSSEMNRCLFYCYEKRTTCWSYLFVLECVAFFYAESKHIFFNVVIILLSIGTSFNCCLEVCPLSCLVISMVWCWCRHHLDIRERLFYWSELELHFLGLA